MVMLLGLGENARQQWVISIDWHVAYLNEQAHTLLIDHHIKQHVSGLW